MVKRKRKSPRTQNNERSEQVAYFPLCVVSNIISRLPADMILRCRCVCKSWYALTYESSFITKQFQWSKHHEESQYMLQFPNGPSVQKLSLLDIHKKKITRIHFDQMGVPNLRYLNQYKLSSYSIVCACNGLLCLMPKRKVDSVIICNPITKECLALPSARMKPLKRCMSYQLGFHFDETVRRYKVIREFRFIYDQPSKFQLITVGENSWKDLDPPNYIVEGRFGVAVFWNGAFHWKLSEFPIQMNRCILSFDIREETFFTIPYPRVDDGIYYHFGNHQLVGAGGVLRIAEHYRRRFLKIWTVIGNESEGFSVVLQNTYGFCFPPRGMYPYDIISKLDEETYLLQVTWKKGINLSPLLILGPNKLEELNIFGVPALFNIVCFKPSFLSPLA